MPLSQRIRSKKFIVIALIVLSLAALKIYFSPLNIYRDIPWKDRDYRNPRPLVLDPNNIPAVNNSSELDVYKLYGPDVDRRLTYKKIRERTINNETFTYNKIIVYQYYHYDYYSGNKNGMYVSGGDVTDFTKIVVYLLNGKVTFIAGMHQEKVNGEYLPPDIAINVGPPTRANYDGKVEFTYDVWPQGMGDIGEYTAQF